MISWLFFMHLLLAQLTVDDSGRVVNSERGLSLMPVPGWSASVDPADPNLVCRLQPAAEGSTSMLSLRVLPTEATTLKPAWTGLRYSVIVELGGRIVSDKAFALPGTLGRQMVYRAVAPSSGRDRMFIRTYLLRAKNLYVFHAVTSPEEYPALRPQFEAAIRSLRWDVVKPTE